MNNIETGGPAFPTPLSRDPEGRMESPMQYGLGGMDLRDYFAAKALVGMLASGIEMGPNYISSVAASAYILADAMIDARKGS